jgi:hypothetical protein
VQAPPPRVIRRERVVVRLQIDIVCAVAEEGAVGMGARFRRHRRRRLRRQEAVQQRHAGLRQLPPVFDRHALGRRARQIVDRIAREIDEIGSGGTGCRRCSADRGFLNRHDAIIPDAVPTVDAPAHGKRADIPISRSTRAGSGH